MVKIGTHNGTFHCDEVLACFLLKQLPEYKDAEIVRSRDSSIINQCDIVVDVGGVFDPTIHRYDHHQRNFNETFKSLNPEKPWDIKLSSAGLIYVHFGVRILKELCKGLDSTIDINILYDKLYEHFVLEVDAIDNGLSMCEGEPLYTISSSLSNRVGYLNPWWNTQDNENTLFKRAMELVGSEFLDKFMFYVKCWWPARELVQSAIDNRFKVHESGSILKFENSGCPWKLHFFDLEKSIECASVLNCHENDLRSNPFQIMFVIYFDGKMWRVQCIPVSEKKIFENRLGLPEEWRGLRESELVKVSGINGCTFVHANGFIGGNDTYEGALEMAVKTIKTANFY